MNYADFQTVGCYYLELHAALPVCHHSIDDGGGEGPVGDGAGDLIGTSHGQQRPAGLPLDLSVEAVPLHHREQYVRAVRLDKSKRTDKKR